MNTEALSLEMKASLTSGGSTWTSQAVPGIEAMHMSDGPYGLRYQGVDGDSLGIGSSVPATCFPPSAGLASSWDRDLIRTVGEALGQEAKSLNVSMLLGPGLNIKRSPLGGRNFEYVSEDPFLAGSYGVAFVSGVQSQGVSAVPKHFAVNNQETDRFRVSAEVDERTLREIYLPAFEMTVKEARPWALMCAYNKINGVYASENKRFLTTLLREEWGFDGLVVSDWGAVVDRVSAVMAGLDIEMPPSKTDGVIVDAVRDGTCNEAVLDRVVDRVRRLLERTAPARAQAMTRPEAFADAHDALARKAARESVVMLKNEGVLPLDPDGASHIALIGAFAEHPRYQGGGSSHVTPLRVHNLRDELAVAMPQATVEFAPGYRIAGAGVDTGAADTAGTAGDSAAAGDSDAALVDEAQRIAKNADVAIVNVGYLESDESEGSDKTSIELREDQQRLVEAVIATGTPTVVVLYGGGVIGIGDWARGANAILEGWLLGQAGGGALADIISGAVSPSGHLNETIPCSLDDVPSRLNFPGSDGVVVYGEGLYVGYRYYDTVKAPVAYPFGFGLSYSTFDVADLKVSAVDDVTAQVSFMLTNTGDRPAASVPQVYVASSLPDRPVHELKGFARVELDPGESRVVTVALGDRSFAHWNSRQERWRVDAGEYRIELGFSSRDIRLTAPVAMAGDGYVPRLEPMSTIGEWMENPHGAPVIAPLVDKVSAGVKNPSPELMAMFLQMPFIKLASWGIGIDGATIERMTRMANGQGSAPDDAASR